MLHWLTLNFTIVAIALIYYAWRDGYARRVTSRERLNERVAYMLWVAANRDR